MPDRLVVDLSGDGQVAVSSWPHGDFAEEVSREPLAWPLDAGALEDLRWYLEDYLLAPYGVWEDRGPGEDWYRKSLAISEELGNRPYTALTCAQLGNLAEARAQAPRALAWNVRCVTLFDEFPSPLTGPGPSALARLARQLGMPALEETWRQVTGQHVPPQVRDYITSQAAQTPQSDA